MWNKLQLHALPTDKASVLGISEKGICVLSKQPDILLVHTPRHLYLISDDEIKEGDWYLLYSHGIRKKQSNERVGAGWSLHQHKNKTSDKLAMLTSADDRKKVIATTNPDLFGNPKGRCYGELKLLSGDGEDGEGMAEPLYCKCKKCGNTNFYSESQAQEGCKTWSTKWITQGVPKIPQSLIQYFVEEQGNVKEMLVEYEHPTYPTKPKFNSYDYEGECPVCGKYETYMGTGDGICTKCSVLKLTPSGEIIWKPVEQKMYSYEEVIELLVAERQRAVNIADQFSEQNQKEADIAAKASIQITGQKSIRAIVLADVANECRLIGNAISGGNALSAALGKTIRDYVIHDFNEKKVK